MTQDGVPTTYQGLLSLFLNAANSSNLHHDLLAHETQGTPSERVIQALWRGQFLKAGQLKLLDGRTIEVLDPGRFLPGSPGPDFRDAHLLIAGKPHQGDVEIHCDAADWHRHGHDRDFEYNKVVLHACVTTSDQQTTDILQNGHTLPRLILKDFADPDWEGALTQARELLLSESEEGAATMAHHGHRCRMAANQLGPQTMRSLLFRAGDSRLLAKVEKLRALGHGRSPAQVLHLAILTTLGQSAAKTLYFLLGARLTIEDLERAALDATPEETPVVLEALLMGVAGLLPTTHNKDWDESSLEYEATLRAIWARYRGQFADRALPPVARWYGQVRPPGFPCRRLAAYAALLARTPRAAHLGDVVRHQVKTLQNQKPKTAKEWKQAVARFGQWLEVPEHPYWDTRYTWGGKRLPRPIALLGADQASALALNALLPWALLDATNQGNAETTQFLKDLYSQFPALPANQVTRYMEHRLFEGKAPPEIPLKLERYRQGLIQLFGDCCRERTAEGCSILD